MKALLATLLLISAVTAMADLDCSAIIRHEKSGKETIVPLVKVTTSKKKEEYLGQGNKFWFYISHDLVHSRLTMEMSAPDGYLFSKAIGPMNLASRTGYLDHLFDVSCR